MALPNTLSWVWNFSFFSFCCQASSGVTYCTDLICNLHHYGCFCCCMPPSFPLAEGLQLASRAAICWSKTRTPSGKGRNFSRRQKVSSDSESVANFNSGRPSVIRYLDESECLPSTNKCWQLEISLNKSILFVYVQIEHKVDHNFRIHFCLFIGGQDTKFFQISND